ncbi:protein adenylyltransferase SelO [Teredinibacter turnerae]|uniref:protein adenylyltransferase SelO n=1 Tax=Teredinibacter turnerae TaxID=2426 RepID=UPI0003602462|nr:YdiU family protein [Teredinibacter turnerae]
MQISNSYLQLGDDFYLPSTPRQPSNPQLFLWNQGLAESLGVADFLAQEQEDPAGFFGGGRLLPNSKPVALAYAGHQFGHFNPRLGDGRAHLLGELRGDTDMVFDVQLKGSGATPFSRGGDGLCGLGPAVREFIMSEAMAALGVPTSRTLAVVTTGDDVYRGDAVPGAVVCRVAASHLRVGTFEYFYAQGNKDAIERLCDYAISRHFPELASSEGPEKYSGFLRAVFSRQVELVCEWLRVGFVHGVMNTDNTTISGETIDYGPCAMISTYNPNTVFSSIDAMGRYRFGHQPSIAHWNMARLTECFLPLLDQDSKQATALGEKLLGEFPQNFEQRYHHMLASKTGVRLQDDSDKKLCEDFLQLLRKQGLDYTNSFDSLTRSLIDPQYEDRCASQWPEWYQAWSARIEQQGRPREVVAEGMRRHNPVVIPRNHHMEAVIDECIKNGSPDAAKSWLKVLRRPYQDLPTTPNYQDPPADGDRSYQTFCGT